MAGYNLEDIFTKPNWKEALKQNKDKYFDKAWEVTLNEIAYVANQLKGTDCELIVGSIRTPKDISKLVSAGPQIITIPTKIVGGLTNIEELKNSSNSLYQNIPDKALINHPMTTYTLKEFEESANSYRK
jgi:transaldolase